MKKSPNSCTTTYRLLLASVALAGWVLANAPSNAAELGTVTGDRVNVRARPGKNAEVVAQLAKGETVEILERQSVTEGAGSADWLRIQMPATAKCYVHTKYLTNGVANADAVYIRCGPGTNFRDVGKLGKGEKVEVTGTKGEWACIKPTPKCSAWVAASFVKVEAAPIPPAAPPAPAATGPVEVVTPPIAVSPATAQPAVQVVETDPEVRVYYVVKTGVLQKVPDPTRAPGAYQLMTPEVHRLQSRLAYLEAPQMNLSRYQGKTVRVFGTQRWRKTERDPVIAVERVEMIW